MGLKLVGNVELPASQTPRLDQGGRVTTDATLWLPVSMTGGQFVVVMLITGAGMIRGTGSMALHRTAVALSSH